MKKHIKNYVILLSIALVIIALDQITKTWIRGNLALGDVYCPIESICEWGRFVHWYNTGVAFGMFQGNSPLFAILTSTVVVLILVFFSRIPDEDWLLRVALGFEMGGAVGNLIDRLIQGHVTDFISVGNFAVFNIADASINVGVGVMILSVIIDEYRHHKRKLAAAELTEGASDSFNSQTAEGDDLADMTGNPQIEPLESAKSTNPQTEVEE
ncbi:MAG: signal peptidase II [Anaerolineaceae bacterium]|nr:signal peptidase II [Anaerolineaceae bacterium]